MALSPDISSRGAAPIYVVDRTDVVRVFVDIPEQDADYVKAGTEASVLARSYRDRPIPGKVTRTSWALNFKSRTLRTEIDLPNPDGSLQPGMYAYADVIIERPDVHALPASALSYVGNAAFCWMYQEGKAVRTEIQTGVGDGEWIEVTERRLSTASDDIDAWAPIDGSERVILGDPSGLSEGAPVEVVPAAAVAKAGAGAGAPAPASNPAPAPSAAKTGSDTR